MCTKDSDIETFLKHRAVEFEKLGKSRTFLIYDEDESAEFKILAYFTLSIQILKVPDEFSNRQIKGLDGYNAKIRGNRITEFPTILIGQFGKNEFYDDSGFSGDELMGYCLSTIFEGQTKLGGRIIMLECQDIPYLIDFYGRYGFERLDRNYEEGELIQLLRILSEEDLIEPQNSH